MLEKGGNVKEKKNQQTGAWNFRSSGSPHSGKFPPKFAKPQHTPTPQPAMRLPLALRPSLVAFAIFLVGGIRAEPFSFPLDNGFPFPNETALEELFTRAGGNFTNAPLAPRFDDDSLTSWKLQAFNEFMEVAFFTQLIANITNNVTGYDLASGAFSSPAERDYVLSSLSTIQAQEEMHAYNANDAVRYFTNGSHIYPCTYVFPVFTFASAVDFAQTMTDMYIGLLANIQQRTARNLGSDSNSIVYVLAQALGQEGQQSGWFRSLRKLAPSAEPFLTTSTREFHMGWMQHWIVEGSCPNMEYIPLPILKPVTLTGVSIGDASHTGNVTMVAPGPVNPDTQRLAFVNGALVPTVVPFKIIRQTCEPGVGNGTRDHHRQRVLRGGGGDKSDDGCVASTTEIVADMPFFHNVMQGLIVMAIVEKPDDDAPYITAQDVTDATVYGPGLLEYT
ncbi:hypothetical protein B0H63DRAFT_475020 [Podospora didyma]|uniref:Late sexual development protein n=1 Tax=Podospora didyma TaxID=330526 RepID=A0AAE0NGK9_9PEZI|nr:hypothetical protein B0H63DRAFT_475020 [Podospora didyma]